MDLNGDGSLDMLSGSYAESSQHRVGYFQVLWGLEGGGFRAPEVLFGSDGQPLVMGDSKASTATRVASRVFAADLDGDGDLDLMSGNLAGSFYYFEGQGEGGFAPASKQLLDANSAPLAVGGKSDPFLVDWDADGDLDLFSGSARGGVWASKNIGTAQQPKFTSMQLFYAPSPDESFLAIGEAQVDGPQRTTRVWVADINEDGALDLLLGDHTEQRFLRAGVDRETAIGRLAQLDMARERGTDEAVRRVLGNQGSDGELLAELNVLRAEIRAKRSEVIREESVGFVWVIYQR